jgi:hypothetical protein
MEAKMALLAMYREFVFRLPPGHTGLKTKTLVTLTPVEGVNVVVHQRNKMAGRAER